MGQNVSSGNYNDWAPAKTSRVIAFHSKSRWDEHFEASKGTNKLMVIDFTATWCGPCKWMEPTIDELAETFTDVDFIRIDVDELMNVSRQYAVQAMPTFLLMKNGKVVDKVVGAKKDELRNKIEQHCNKSQSNLYHYAA
ncbi:hypothetical protein BT93_B2323 [Corymbia citriodora subsp. variegata]|nr:hypothetical protein BT93_B2323 [Corymbia citriodora subsp. variegata]